MTSHNQKLSHARTLLSPGSLSRLASLLPSGYDKHFLISPSSRPGLRIICPVCGATPPKSLIYGYLRWRWMAVHITNH